MRFVPFQTIISQYNRDNDTGRKQSFSGSASFFLTLKQDLDYYAKEMVKVDYCGGTPMERMQNITFFRKRVKTLDNPKAI